VTRPQVQHHGLELASRPEVQKRYEEARRTQDSSKIAYAAFALAYSYDHYEPHDHRLAVRYLNEAVNLYPNWPEAVFNRAIAYIHLKKYSEAINGFQRAQQLFFPSAKDSNVPSRSAAELTRGKLLLFKAEALAGRGQGRDLARAGLEVLRAETAFRKCEIDPEAVFWLNQIDGRLDATFSVEERLDKELDTVHHPVSFVIGIVVAVLLLSTLGWLMFTSPPADRPMKDESIPTTKNAKTLAPTLLSALAGPSPTRQSVAPVAGCFCLLQVVVPCCLEDREVASRDSTQSGSDPWNWSRRWVAGRSAPSVRRKQAGLPSRASYQSSSSG